jgi:hypothetical protein
MNTTFNIGFYISLINWFLIFFDVLRAAW